MTPDEIQDEVTKLFDLQVERLSKLEYKDLLENIVSDFEAKLECVKEELAGDEE